MRLCHPLRSFWSIHLPLDADEFVYFRAGNVVTLRLYRAPAGDSSRASRHQHGVIDLAGRSASIASSSSQRID